MAEPKRKYETDVAVVQNLFLEQASSESEKPKRRKSSRKRGKNNGFSPDVIYGIIEKIKDM